MNEQEKQDPPVKSYTPKELRSLYGITYKQWKRWRALVLHKVGLPHGGVYNPAQVRIMFEHFGTP